MITIDGATGGGQMLRYATVLSAITRKTVRIINIRATRPGGGLSHQHLHGVNAMAELANLKLTGNIIRSTDLLIEPGEPTYKSEITIDTRTAASVTLIAQMMLPWMMYHPSIIHIKGGTNVDFSPPIEYFRNVFMPVLHSIGFKLQLDILKYGTYPKGGGHIVLTSIENILTPLIMQVKDPYLQDQVLIYERLIPGSKIDNRIELTEHTTSALYVINKIE